MALGTAVSRILGQARTAMLVWVIGSSTMAADAFQLANQLPTVLYNLLISGALSAVLVPQVVRAYKRNAGQEYVDRLLTLGFVVLGVLTVVLTAAVPLLILLYGRGDGNHARISLAVAFGFWTMPQVFFYGMYALIGQVLNARGSFGPYMWAPVANNVVAISTMVVFVWRFHAWGTHAPEVWTSAQVLLLAGGATLGIVAQALVLLPAMRRAGVRFRFRWGFRGVGLRTAGRVAVWTFVTLAIGQVGVIAIGQVGAAARDAFPPVTTDAALTVVVDQTGPGGQEPADADTPPPAVVGTPYTFTVPATDGSTFAVKEGTLPDGLTLDRATGAVTGVPTVPGDYAFTVTASKAVVGVAGRTMYDQGFMIFMLPHSLVTVSLLTALFPRLSRQAADRAHKDVARTFSSGARVVGLFTVLAGALGLLLAAPLVRAVLPTTDVGDVAALSRVVMAFMVGLPAFGVWSACQRVYYAYEDARSLVPIAVGSAAVVVLGTGGVWWLLDAHLWVFGAALAMSMSYLLSTGMALAGLKVRIGTVGGGALLRTYLRATVAVALAIAVGWAVLTGLRRVGMVDSRGMEGWLVAVGVCVVVGTVVTGIYLAVLKLLRVAELDLLLGSIRNLGTRLKRR